MQYLSETQEQYTATEAFAEHPVRRCDNVATLEDCRGRRTLKLLLHEF